MSIQSPSHTQPQLKLMVYYQVQPQIAEPSNPISVLGKIGQWLLAEFRTRQDPKVWQTSDQSGNIWWHAYHPVTGCTAIRESEAEILQWIDQRLKK